MSRRSKLPARPARRRIWLGVVFASALVLIPAVYWVSRAGEWFVPSFDSTAGEVLETRIVLDHTRESEFGGSIFYRLEARVKYRIPVRTSATLPELPEDQWLTASDPTTAPELLKAAQAKKATACRVFWIKNHPETAKCTFD